MKDNVVFWGSNAEDQKILAVLRLRAKEKKVDIWTFLKDKVDEDFVESLFADWENIDFEKFPEPASFEERDVSETDLLPVDIKADQTDLIIRTEQDWQFKILSIRVAEMLLKDLEALRDQIKALNDYDKELWETAKVYNNKVMAHSSERTLSRGQTNELRVVVNECFELLKAKMAKDNERFKEESEANKKMAFEKINSIVEMAKNPAKAKDAFEELKKVQNHIKSIRLTKDGRNKVWSKLNDSFNEIKASRKNQFTNRLAGRINGLEKAIDKMQRSINYDTDSVDFHSRKSEHINATKLEMQLRDAKIKMLKTTIDSKQVKLDDMLLTLDKLQKQLAKESKATEEKAAKEAKVKEEKEAKAKEKKEAKAAKAKEEKTTKVAGPPPKADVAENNAAKPTAPDEKAGIAEAVIATPVAPTETISPSNEAKEEAPTVEEQTPKQEETTVAIETEVAPMETEAAPTEKVSKIEEEPVVVSKESADEVVDSNETANNGDAEVAQEEENDGAADAISEGANKAEDEEATPEEQSEEEPELETVVQSENPPDNEGEPDEGVDLPEPPINSGDTDEPPTASLEEDEKIKV